MRIGPSCLSTFLLLSLLPAQQVKPAKSDATAIVHATLINVTGGPVRPDSVVIIAGDRITEVGTFGKTTIPKNAHVVEATGKFLIPGLWDMHVHPDGPDYLPLFLA